MDLPYFQHCSLCLVEFDAILKLETVDLDQEYILQKSKISEKVTFEKQHYKPNGNESKEELRKRFYSEVPCQQVTNLIRMYSMDLEMFEYSTKSFLEYCRPGYTFV